VTGALAGISVVEIANYVSGPYAGGMLADLGADVIKVESPPHGDPYRGWASGNYSPMFCSLNGGKRSTLLDLKSPEGAEAARRLIERADVLIENLRPGVMDRLGLGYDEVRIANPRLVYCSITGFGLDGPYADRPGYDTVGQAMSGLLSLLTDADDARPMGISLSDHLAGLYATYGILAALMGRERTGSGQRVDTSLLQASTNILAENMARFLRDGGSPPDRTTRVRTAQVYAGRDEAGLPFVIHLSSPDKFWRGLMRAIDRTDLLDDPRFASRQKRIANREAIQELLDSAFSRGSREGWLRRLRAEEVPSSPINDLQEVLDDPQVKHLGLVREVVHPVAGPMRILRNGVNLHGTPTDVAAAPLAGEHTREVLAEIGLAAPDAASNDDVSGDAAPSPVRVGTEEGRHEG
jgi:crotonobetainyl-CoA:carnitine CoA-transferase CaiB-like acyl-CoA transferase